MHSRLLIISADFPPTRGGVADHTLRLAEEMSQRFAVTVLTSKGAPVATTFPVAAEISSWTDTAELMAALQKHAPDGSILWQYVPQMYGRGGVNGTLPRVMADWRAAHRRQILIAHEMYSPFSVWPQRSYYAWQHRRQWQALAAAADVIGVSTAAWIEHRLTPAQRQKAILLPSPSAIPLVSIPAEHATLWRRQQGWPEQLPVLAYFGSQGGVKQFDWVLSAWQQAQTQTSPVGLVVIGEPPAVEIPVELKPWFRPLGYCSPSEVSQALQAADLLLLPFADGVSERRTSFMAGLQHGCAVVSTHGPSTGSALQAADFLASVPSNDPAAFVSKVADLLASTAGRSSLGQRARAAYAAHYDWAVVEQRLAEKAIG